MNAPRFSISTPVGAYHDLLPYCLESLRRQSVPLEVCLLDASSDPRVERLADAFQDVITYRRHGPDGGQAAAIREGWDHSDGEILGWLNADDLLYPDALAAAAAAFAADPGLDVVYGHSAICDDRMRMTGYHWAVTPAGHDLRLGCNISQPSCFFRRTATAAAGGLDAGLHYTMDWDLWLRLQANGARFAFVNEPLSAVFWGEGTKTSGFNAARRGELTRLIRRYAPPELQARVFRGFAMQAALDQVRPTSVQRFARERLFRNRPRVFGVGPDGRLDETAVLKWFHLEAAPKRTLSVTVSGQGRLDAQASRPVANTEWSGTGVAVRFAEPVSAGETVTVELRRADGSLRRLRLCEWTA
jgi:GT2 family glycosyltransferase